MAVFLRSRGSGAGFAFLVFSRPPVSYLARYHISSGSSGSFLQRDELRKSCFLHLPSWYEPAFSFSSLPAPAPPHPHLPLRKPLFAAPSKHRPTVDPTTTRHAIRIRHPDHSLHGHPHIYAGERGRTTGTHLFSASSNSNSSPLSASRMNLLASLEKETRGSPSKSSGFWGN